MEIQDQDVMDDVGERARVRRKELGLTQEEVAYSMKIEQTVLSKIERGAKKPTSQFARRLAAALGLPEGAFLKSNDPDSRAPRQ